MSSELHEIGKEFYLLRSKEEFLHRNIYIKRFVGTHGESMNMIMDPGTSIDYPVLSKTLKELIGGIKNVHAVFLSHQDPDVSSNIMAILASAPKAVVFASEDTWRLISMYGIPEKRFRAVESFKFDVLRIKKTGHYIQFIPAKYCHFVGATMFYDFESKVIFTGDFLGGVDSRKGNGIYANEESWEGISLFHQIYMPSKKALQIAVDKIGLLNKIPEVIAPQHGDVIKGDFVNDFLSRIASLDVGMDAAEWEEEKLETLIVAFNGFLDMIKNLYPDIHESLIASLSKAGEFTPSIRISGDSVVQIKILPNDAIYHFWKEVIKVSDADTLSELRGLFSSSLSNFGIEIPDFISEETKTTGIVKGEEFIA